ncbi:MAG TPA: hypothetical protein VLB51_00110 [Methylomirabilota bacterium]|nr:hypothetical protein [Methylomirabilota bacterium]
MDVNGAGIVGMISTDVVHPPEDVKFGPEGSLYGAGMFHGDVWRIAPDGSVTSQMVGPGVSPIAFDGEGRMFVSEPWMTDTLWELDPDLEDPPRMVAQGLGGVEGTEFGADGMLYAALMWAGEVVRIDVDADPVTAETIATIPGACTAKFGPDGMLYVVDRLGFTIQRLDPAGGSHTTYAQLPWGPDNLAFNDQGRLFVSSYTDGALAEVMPDGAVVPSIPGSMIMAVGVAVLPRTDGGESVFVGSVFSLREYDAATGAERSVERFRLPPQGYAGSGPIAGASDKLVLSMHFGIPAVQLWDPATRTVVAEYTDVIGPQQAVEVGGDLVIVDLGAGAGQARLLRVHDGSAELLADASDGLVVPTGLATDGADLWVADWATGVIFKAMEQGEPLPALVPVAQGLQGPEGMALDGDGRLLVVESGAARLSRVDPTTGAVTQLVSGLAVSADGGGAAMMPPYGHLSSIAVSPSGTIYVAADAANAVYRMTPRTVVLPAANARGHVSSRWSTDLELHNRGTTLAGLTVEVLREGEDNSSPEAVRLDLAPALSARYPNALETLFDLRGTAALRVTSLGGDVMISARTSTPCGSGGCSQFTPAATVEDLAGPDRELRLIQLENTETHRTNIGLISAADVPTAVRIDLYLADGTPVGAENVALQPFGFEQVNDVFHSLDEVYVAKSLLDTVSDAYAVITSPTAGAAVCAYASVVDNRTNDGIFIPAR